MGSMTPILCADQQSMDQPSVQKKLLEEIPRKMVQQNALLIQIDALSITKSSAANVDIRMSSFKAVHMAIVLSYLQAAFAISDNSHGIRQCHLDQVVSVHSGCPHCLHVKFAINPSGCTTWNENVIRLTSKVSQDFMRLLARNYCLGLHKLICIRFGRGKS